MTEEASLMIRNAEHLKMQKRAEDFLSFAKWLHVDNMKQADELQVRNQQTYGQMKEFKAYIEDDIKNAKAYIQTGELALGQFHAAITVFGDSQKQAIMNGVAVSNSFINSAVLFGLNQLYLPHIHFLVKCQVQAFYRAQCQKVQEI